MPPSQRRPRPPHGAKFFDFARNDALKIGHGCNKYPLSAVGAQADRAAGFQRRGRSPQFALNDSQSVQKAARLNRHERLQRTRDNPFLTKLRPRRRAPSRHVLRGNGDACRYWRLRSCCWDCPAPHRSRISPGTSPIIRMPRRRRGIFADRNRIIDRPDRSPHRGVAASTRSRSKRSDPADGVADIAADVVESADTSNTDSNDSDLSLDDLCNALYTSAQDNDLPVAFFANLIWQESRLRDDAVSRKGALGIAQFMPETAAETGLDNPFDPLQAIPASARFLRELRQQFGNLGFVAAAYNAGAHRVVEWLKHRGSLPRETRGYVARVTGLSVEPGAAWR